MTVFTRSMSIPLVIESVEANMNGNGEEAALDENHDMVEFQRIKEIVHLLVFYRSNELQLNLEKTAQDLLGLSVVFDLVRIRRDLLQMMRVSLR